MRKIDKVSKIKQIQHIMNVRYFLSGAGMIKQCYQLMINKLMGWHS